MIDQTNDAASSAQGADSTAAAAPAAAPVAPAPAAEAAATEADPEPAYAPPGGPIVFARPEGKDGSAGALVICGGKAPAKSEKRIVIVAEVRNDDGSDSDATYPGGGDVYLRFTRDLDMKQPAEATLFTLGVDLQQFAFTQLTSMPNAVNVGPAHPAYAAINLAYSMGARDIEVTGLSDHWKARLQPYVDQAIANPAHGDVKITLS